MFLGHVRSLRNITTYVPWPGLEAEEHKAGPYVPRPAEEHKRPICESRPFFILPRSSAPSCLLPMHWPPRPSLAPNGRARQPCLAPPPFTNARWSEPLCRLMPRICSSVGKERKFGYVPRLGEEHKLLCSSAPTSSASQRVFTCPHPINGSGSLIICTTTGLLKTANRDRLQ
jgi:hypothetical protein